MNMYLELRNQTALCEFPLFFLFAQISSEKNKIKMDDESSVSSIGSRDASLSDSDSLLNVHDDINDPEDPTGLTIYLARCAELRVVPVSTLAKSLAITTVHLAHHGIGPRGALALSSALAVNRTITDIDLSDNGMEEEGCCLTNA